MSNTTHDQTRLRDKFLDYMHRCGDVMEGRKPLASLAIRQCGNCNLCCTAPAIEASELNPSEHALVTPKPAGDKCRHCTETGCAIYHKRPEICHGYMCLWLVGLTDRPPMEAGVCWTFQPDKLTERSTLVKGHCHDVDAVLSDVDNRSEIRDMLSLASTGLPVSAVALSSAETLVRFSADGSHPDIMADIDPADPMHLMAADNTTRRAQWRI